MTHQTHKLHVRMRRMMRLKLQAYLTTPSRTFPPVTHHVAGAILQQRFIVLCGRLFCGVKGPQPLGVRPARRQTDETEIVAGATNTSIHFGAHILCLCMFACATPAGIDYDAYLLCAKTSTSTC